jgi:CBS domain containing-hemolysin-like protein
MRDALTGEPLLMECLVDPDDNFICTEASNSPLLGNEHTASMTTGQIIKNSAMALILTLCAGLMSGLTIGLASIDRLSLEIEAKGNPEAKKQADKIFPVIDKYHWMLVTLLLFNAACMECLPLSLDKLLPGWAAIVVSVTAVLFFGEIIPQAICTGPS